MTRRGDFGCLCALFIGMVSNMTMSRRDFVKVSGTGLMALLVSGCGIGAAAGAVGASGSSSGSGSSGSNGAPPSGLAKDYKAAGKPMKIVVINSSPHPKDESTSVFLSEQFTAGAQKAGHTVFTFDAARAQTSPVPVGLPDPPAATADSCPPPCTAPSPTPLIDSLCASKIGASFSTASLGPTCDSTSLVYRRRFLFTSGGRPTGALGGRPA